MSQPLYTLGIAPNAWLVNATSADLSRPPIAPRPIVLPTVTKTLRLDLNKTALLVIDLQNDFCHPAGWLAHIGVDVSPTWRASPLGNRFCQSCGHSRSRSSG